MSYVSWEEKALGSERHDGFDTPTHWIVYQERRYD